MNNRYDFSYLFDCKDGNPNGDPDAAKAPRIAPGYDNFVQQGEILNNRISNTDKSFGQDVDAKDKKCHARAGERRARRDVQTATSMVGPFVQSCQLGRMPGTFVVLFS